MYLLIVYELFLYLGRVEWASNGLSLGRLDLSVGLEQFPPKAWSGTEIGSVSFKYH